MENPRTDVPRTVAIVPHTHWDREWYRSFQAFRLRLLDVLDRLLPEMEADPSYAHFLLDGQMAAVDDYLELRPAAEPVLRRLAAAGRIAVGPWYILMDEFLVSGETIIRNLQLGTERAAAFAGAMPVGYLPDMFGHIAQMPQILRLAGLQHAVVWRGVPAAVDRNAFWWSALDGSTVRAEYLRVGYGNGASMPDDAKALIRRVAAHRAELGDMLVSDPDIDQPAPILWMNGTDHQAPQPWLGRVVTEANALQSDYHLVVTSLPDYLAQAPTEGLPAWTGELRSGARANLLMGVASNRVDVKQAAARAERALERQAEPLTALFLPADLWPGPELALAWREMIRNSAHDSICACSVDEVGTAVLHRFDEATAIADGLRRKAVRAAAATMAANGPVVINPSRHTRGGVVEVIVPGGEPIAGAQVLDRIAAGTTVVTGRGADLDVLIGQLSADGWLPMGGGAASGGVDLHVSDSEIELIFKVGTGGPSLDAGAVMAEVWAQAGAHRDQPLRVRVERGASQRLAVHVPDVPGFGWAAWSAGPLTVPPVTASAAGLDNRRCAVIVDQRNGTFALNGRIGFDRLVDDGDEGDTYNFSPPADDVVIDRPDAVSVDVIEHGPVRGRLRISRTYRWPHRVEDGKRVGERTIEVTTELELRAGEDMVRVTTSLENHCRDHRLRAWFPLPERTTESRAECAFGVVTRGLTAEGGDQEYGLPTFPSRRFVSAGGLTVVHDGLLEYEVVDEGRALALTLLRATGMLSRDHPAYRPNPAGPALAVEGPQMQGRLVVRYALSTHPGSDPYVLADQAWLPLELTHGAGMGDRPPRGQALAVAGAEVSSVQRVGGVLEVRVFNPSDRDATVMIETPDASTGWLVDLIGRPLEPFDGSFPLRPWGIATARLT